MSFFNDLGKFISGLFRSEETKMKRINQHKLAIAISKIEGGKVNLPIAQIKEVQKKLLEELAKYPDKQILALINKFRK